MREGPTYRKAPRQLGGNRGAGYRDLYTDTHCTTTPARPIIIPTERRVPLKASVMTLGMAGMAFAFTWIACYLCGVLL